MWCFVEYCWYFFPFSFDHCIVCPSSIYGLWLALWYLHTFVLSNDDKTQYSNLVNGYRSSQSPSYSPMHWFLMKEKFEDTKEVISIKSFKCGNLKFISSHVFNLIFSGGIDSLLRRIFVIFLNLQLRNQIVCYVY